MKTEDCIDYAFGEMRGRRREAFERELTESELLLQSLQETTDWLETLRQLSRPADSLDSTRREFLLAACHTNIASRERRSKIIRFTIPLSLAALALFVFHLAEPSPQALHNQTPASNGSVHYEPVLPLDHAKNINSQTSNALASSKKSPASSIQAERKQTSCATTDVERPSFSNPISAESPRHTRETEDNPFLDARQIPETWMPLSDSHAFYAQIRSDILAGKLPDPASIRIDELINAFTYEFDQKPASGPFAILLEAGPSPWNSGRLLVKIGFQINDTPSPAHPDVSSFRDIMLSVRFNPAEVASHRLIGYEKNGALSQTLDQLPVAKSPFTTTTIYEIEPANSPTQSNSNENLLLATLHYKTPVQNVCQHMVASYPVSAIPAADQNSTDFRFASAVVAFGMKLAGNPEVENITWSAIKKLASANLGPDPDGQRADFANLVAKASRLAAG
jgi:hypothetical protein